MALDTYSDLKTAIADWLDRDDLTAKIDDFIDLAEARHKREIRTREMLSRSSLTIDDRFVDLPSGYLEAQELRILTSPVTVLEYVSPHQMTRLRKTGTGKPSYFTVHTQIEFDEDADQSYSGEIIYYSAFTALSDANTSNDLLTRAPDAYLYGALSASAPFLMHDERIVVWETMYNKVVEDLNGLDRRSRTIGPIASRVAGATP